MRKGAIQFCFKLLICGIEWETFMGEVECKLLERNFTPFSSKHLFRKDSQSFFDLSHSLVR